MECERRCKARGEPHSERASIAAQVVLPEPPKEERLALMVAANFPSFMPSLSQEPEKRSWLRAAEERISNRVAELELLPVLTLERPMRQEPVYGGTDRRDPTGGRGPGAKMGELLRRHGISQQRWHAGR